MARTKKCKKEQHDIATQNFKSGYQIVYKHPLFYPLLNASIVLWDENNKYPENGLAFATSDGYILCWHKCQVILRLFWLAPLLCITP